MATWNRVAAARNDFADMVDGLSAEQLAQATYCEGWSAQAVLCHLTSFAETSFVGFFNAMRRARFNFAAVSQNMLDPLLSRPVPDVATSLRNRAAKSAAMPGFPEALVLADVLIHTQDVRRPLGLQGELDGSQTKDALDFLTNHKMAKNFVERRALEPVGLTATDMDWTFGSGAEITGTAEALMMGIAGRPVIDDLAGPGLAHWT